MDPFEKKYGITEDQAVKEYHRSRRMFCIHDGNLYIADAFVPYSHAVWFEKMGWISETDDTLMDSIVRGSVDKTGDIYFYVGWDFNLNEHTEKIFFLHLSALVEKLNLDLDGFIFGGFIKKNVGEKWPPKKMFGTIKDCLQVSYTPEQREREMNKNTAVDGLICVVKAGGYSMCRGGGMHDCAAMNSLGHILLETKNPTDVSTVEAFFVEVLHNSDYPEHIKIIAFCFLKDPKSRTTAETKNLVAHFEQDPANAEFVIKAKKIFTQNQ